MRQGMSSKTEHAGPMLDLLNGKFLKTQMCQEYIIKGLQDDLCLFELKVAKYVIKKK